MDELSGVHRQLRNGARDAGLRNGRSYFRLRQRLEFSEVASRLGRPFKQELCDTAALAWTFKEFIRSRPLATGRRRGLKTGGKARLTFVRDAWQIRSIGYDSRSGYLIGCQNWSNITARKMIRGLWIGRHRVVRKRSSRYCGVSRLEPDGIGHFSPGFQVWRHSTRKGTIVTRPSDEFPPRHGIRSQLRHGPPNYNVPCLQRL